MLDEITNLQVEVDAIRERNSRVEAEKAWETSLARKTAVAVLTYGVIVLFFYAADFPKPFLNAIVPTLGYLLSTLSLDWLKKFWLNRQSKK
jgi:hypothetical protein